jgi:hypothetical protein
MPWPGWPRSIIAWKSRRKCAQHHCNCLIHQYDFSRSQVATPAYWLPNSRWAISAVRPGAMRNRAANGVTAAHRYARFLFSRQGVSSMLTCCVRTYFSTPNQGSNMASAVR